MSTFVRDMDRDGFALLHGAIGSEEVLRARDYCVTEWEAFKNANDLWFGGGRILGHINYYPAADMDLLSTILRDRGIGDLVRSVLGGDCRVRAVVGNVNLPGSRYQPDHIDGNLKRDFLLLNVPLGDVDETNGAIELYPATHRTNYSFAEFRKYRRTRSASRVNTRSGDLIFRYPNVWHRGTPNRSARPRFMLGVMYGPKSSELKPLVVGPQHLPLLEDAPIPGNAIAGDGGGGRFAPNYFGLNLAGRAKELLWCFAPAGYDLARCFR